MRVLMVLEAGGFYPSGTIRGYIYRDKFRAAGIEVTYVSRLLESFLRLAAAPSRLMRLLLRLPYAARAVAWMERRAVERNEAGIAKAARGVDAVYMSKVTSLAFVQKLRAATRARLVLDFGDAVWLPRWGNRDFPQLLAAVDAVTTDNDFTAQYVRSINPNCTVIPDCPQIEAFEPRRPHIRKPSGERIVLGWIGSASTAYNLYVAWEALERVFARHPNVHLRVVGSGSEWLPPFERVRYSCLPRYQQAQMVEEGLQMHVGLFPLQDVEACRVRGVLKATVYMSAEAAVIASPVGQVPELISDGVNGALAASTAEWEEKLERLIVDAPYRERLARAGLEQVRRDFTVDRSFGLLRSVLEGR